MVTTRIGAPRRLAAWLVAALFWLYYLSPVLVGRLPLLSWLGALHVLIGLVAIAALRWRSARPVQVLGVIMACLVVAPPAIGAAFVAQAAVARRRPGRIAILTGLAVVAVKAIALVVWFGPMDAGSRVELLVATAGIVIATLVGWLARSQAESELARLNEARLQERERIASEMHDVVAHRISLVAMHAGALAYRTDLDPEEARAAARLIQTNAKRSLEELRTLLTRLRGPERPPEPPQPTLAELGPLLADAREAGQRIALIDATEPGTVPAGVSRHAFRIIQEGLTNARKHAPRAEVEVRLAGAPGADLSVAVTNALAPPRDRPDRSGGRLGLVGLTERVELLGGSVRHGPIDGRFELAARLPWPFD